MIFIDTGFLVKRLGVVVREDSHSSFCVYTVPAEGRRRR
jgi:hypothetical protein